MTPPNALGALGAAASPSSSRLIAASAFHKPDGSIDPRPFQQPPLPASGSQVMTAPLAAPPGPAAATPVQAPQPQPTNALALASLGQGAPVPPAAPPPPPPRLPMVAHAHMAGQRIPQMQDAELAVFRAHNAVANTAISGMLARSSVAYRDVVQLLTGLAQRGAIPVDAALQAASRLPTDPQQLRQVLVNLQQFVVHMGAQLQAEHHGRIGRR